MTTTTRWLGAFTLAVLLGHHLGTLTTPLGPLAGGTGWSDWLDLLTPYAVVGTCWGALLASRADRTSVCLGGLGGVLYAQGHGIHLSAKLPRGPVAVLSAVALGLTHASNALEGGTAALSTAVAVALAVRFRSERLVVLAYGVAVLGIAGWGLWFAVVDGRMFPQPSEL